MELHPIVMQIIGALWTVFVGLSLSYMKNSQKARRDIAESLKRLEILFEVKIPLIEKKIEEHETKITQIQSRIHRR